MGTRDAGSRSRARSASRAAWVLLMLLAISSYVFWVLPRQIPNGPVEVTFERDEASKHPQGAPVKDSAPGASEKVLP